MALKRTDLFDFTLRQLMYERGWKRVPRKVKRRWLRDYWRSFETEDCLTLERK